MKNTLTKLGPRLGQIGYFIVITVLPKKILPQYFLQFLLFSLKNHNSEVSPLIPKFMRLVHSGIISQQPVQIWNATTEYRWTYSIFHKHISNDAKWRSNFGAKKTNNAFITEFPEFYFEGYFCEFYQPAKFHQNQ